MALSYDNLSGDTTGLTTPKNPANQNSDAWGPSYSTPSSPSPSPSAPSPSKPSQGGSSWSTPSIYGSSVNLGTGTPAASVSAPANTPNLGLLRPPSSVQAGATSSGNTGVIGPTTTDPYAQDELARSVYTQLKAAGHDVNWSGTQLMVDGRPYDVGTGATQQTTSDLGSHQNPTPGGPQGTAPPMTGNLRDPSYAAQLVAYYAQQPGADPSLANDPNYWIQKMTSGEFGSDPAYAIQKMQTAWKDAPLGGESSSWAPSFASLLSAGHSSTVPNFEEPRAPWGPGGPSTYTPGEIGFSDIPNFTADQLVHQMQGGKSGTSLDDLVTKLQQSEGPLDPHTVDTMKASMKDTLAEQQQLEDQNLKGQGAALGIGDSNWLASQRAAGRQSTNQAIAAGGQNIDIQAAQTNQQAKEAAASLGTSYSSVKGQQIMGAVSSGLQRATITGDRMQLRESVKQAAAQSGQNAQKMMADWLQQNSGLKLDYAKLKTQDSQYLEDLMMRVSQLKASQDQFGMTYGLDVANLQRNLQNDAWQQSWADTHGLGGA